jgi:peroxiredoxin
MNKNKLTLLLLFTIALWGEIVFSQNIDVGLNKHLKGTNAPDVTLETTTGKKYSIKELKGKIIVINFLYLDLKPCKLQIKELNELAKSYHHRKKEVIFLAVFEHNSLESVKKYLSKNEFQYEYIVSKDTSITRKFSAGGYPIGYPTNMIIDRQGIIYFIQNGYEVGQKTGLQEALVELISK